MQLTIKIAFPFNQRASVVRWLRVSDTYVCMRACVWQTSYWRRRCFTLICCTYFCATFLLFILLFCLLSCRINEFIYLFDCMEIICMPQFLLPLATACTHVCLCVCSRILCKIRVCFACNIFVVAAVVVCHSIAASRIFICLF